MGLQRPASVTNAIRVQMALVAVSGLTTLLTVLQRNDLVVAWAEGNPTARPILDEGGLSALEDSSINIPAFGQVAVVSFVTFALLAAVLLALFRHGHNSARISLTVLAVFFLFAMLAIYRVDPPTLFAVCAAVSAVLDVVLVYFLWHRDTNAFLRGAAIASGRSV